MKPTDTLKTMEDYRKKLNDALRLVVKVGLPEGTGPGVYPGGQTVIEVGAIHEFGIGVPRRSWLRMPMERHRRELAKFIGKQFDLVTGQNVDAKKALGLVGAKARNYSTEAFRTNGYGLWPPLAPSTVKSKKRRGKQTPLIDTGTLRQSITWRVD